MVMIVNKWSERAQNLLEYELYNDHFYVILGGRADMYENWSYDTYGCILIFFVYFDPKHFFLRPLS